MPLYSRVLRQQIPKHCIQCTHLVAQAFLSNAFALNNSGQAANACMPAFSQSTANQASQLMGAGPFANPVPTATPTLPGSAESIYWY